VPRPPGPRPGATAQPVPRQRSGNCRATVRDALEATLYGIELSRRDRQFLSRLVHWDKRHAASVISLLRRARLAGREEVALSGRQLEIVLGALEDSAAYRASGADAAGCWDCENIPGGRCADHSRDGDRARACAELAAQLASGTMAGSPADPATGDFRRPARLSGFRRHASPVAS
jgi:hypothetical protein